MLSCYHNYSQISPNKAKQADHDSTNKTNPKQKKSIKHTVEMSPSEETVAARAANPTATRMDRICSRLSAISRKCTPAGYLHITRRPNGASVKPWGTTVSMSASNGSNCTGTAGILRKRTNSTTTTDTCDSDEAFQVPPVMKSFPTRRRQKRSSRFVLLKNAVRGKADLKSPSHSLFDQLHQNEQRCCYLDPVKVYCCDFIETTTTTTTHAQVRFEETVDMIEIPKHRDYSPAVRKALWYSKEERDHILCLSLREYFYEECNWEIAIEEDEFIVDECSGVQLHPAHVCTEAEYKRKSAATEDKYFERIQKYKEQFRSANPSAQQQQQRQQQQHQRHKRRSV